MQTQAMTNDDFDLAKFIKLMKMTTATIDGEALAAIRMANKMLRTNGHDWEQLLKSKITIVNDPFASIPTPPAARTAPPPTPKPAYQPPPPPARRARNAAEVSQWLNIVTTTSHPLHHQDVSRIQQIVVDWNHHQPNMFDYDYDWLRNLTAQVTPMPRSRAEIEKFIGILEMAPLSQTEVNKFVSIRDGWQKRGNHTMNQLDYSWLERHYHQHLPRGPRGGKAKRVI